MRQRINGSASVPVQYLLLEFKRKKQLTDGRTDVNPKCKHQTNGRWGKAVLSTHSVCLQSAMLLCTLNSKHGLQFRCNLWTNINEILKTQLSFLNTNSHSRMEGNQIRVQAKQTDSGMFTLILPLRFSVHVSVNIAFKHTEFFLQH